MDYSNRNPGPAAPVHPAPAGHGTKSRGSRFDRGEKGMLSRVGIVVGLLLIVVLIVGLIAFVYSANDNTSSDNESSYIISGKLQAVFLNTGQVYFGNIQKLNNDYLILTNIYYLQTSSSSSSASSSSSSNNVTLVKLGCELHQPYDQMIINRSQVTFWENLHPSGQVAQAVAKFQAEYPNGQKCADQSTSSSNTTNSVQNSTSNSGSSTPSTGSSNP